MRHPELPVLRNPPPVQRADGAAEPGWAWIHPEVPSEVMEMKWEMRRGENTLWWELQAERRDFPRCASPQGHLTGWRGRGVTGVKGEQTFSQVWKLVRY